MMTACGGSKAKVFFQSNPSIIRSVNRAIFLFEFEEMSLIVFVTMFVLLCQNHVSRFKRVFEVAF